VKSGPDGPKRRKAFPETIKFPNHAGFLGQTNRQGNVAPPAEPFGTPKGMFELTSFETLGLSQYLMNTLSANSFETPTPIQALAIPHLLEGRDLIGLAQTGTGKTFGFGLPIIHRLIKEGAKPDPKAARALILAPTRELVNQIAESLKLFTKKSPLKITTVVGGASLNKQAQILEKGIDILVATPGRLLDLCNRRALTLTATRYLVLDEADQMLDLGFIHDLKKIVTMVPKRRQTMLFSATMPQAIAELGQNYLTDPVEVSVTPPGKTADKVAQHVHFVEGRDHKTVLLKQELRKEMDALSLVFAKTKHGAEKLMKHLDHSGFSTASIHGNKSQGQRDRALKAFRDGEIRILVATDVAARGIDVPGVTHVYNYDLPHVPESYVHRIGRTARAGREGVAIAFCGPEDIKLLYDIEKLIGTPIPVASGDRPEWQGKGGAKTAGTRKNSGGGAGHRGRRPTGHEPKPEPREVSAEAGPSEPVVRDSRNEPRGDRRPRRDRDERGGREDNRPRSSFSEVEELNGGEFRPVRGEARREGGRERFPGDSRNERGERQPRQELRGEERRGNGPGRGAGGKRPGQGQANGQHQGQKPVQNRHSPARHAGFAGDANIAATGGERAPMQENRGPRKPDGGKKRWHGGGNRADNGGGNRGGQGGGERRAQQGNRRG
jgi:ATP-dependent RNA helicase RhlE